MWGGLKSEQKAVPNITWTKGSFGDIYVNLMCSSLNIWGGSALCTLHLSSFSPFIGLSLSVTTTDSPGILRPPLPMAGVAWTLTHNILGLLSLYPSARLSNHQSEENENSTNLTAATTHTFTGLRRENTLLPWVGMWIYVCEFNLWLPMSQSHTQKKLFLLEKQISSGFYWSKTCFHDQ